MDNNIKELVPVDIQLSKNVNSDFSDNKKIAKDNKISIENTLTNNGFDYKTNFKDIVKFNTYEADKFTIKDTLGDSYKQVAEQYNSGNLKRLPEVCFRALACFSDGMDEATYESLMSDSHNIAETV